MKVVASTNIKGASEKVFNYIADQRNAVKWDKTVSKVKKVSSGPINRLTKFELESKGHSIEYVIMQYDKPERLVFSSSMPGFEVDDRYDLKPVGELTKVTQTTEINMDGLINDLLTLVKPVFIVKAKMSLRSLRKAYDSS